MHLPLSIILRLKGKKSELSLSKNRLHVILKIWTNFSRLKYKFYNNNYRKNREKNKKKNKNLLWISTCKLRKRGVNDSMPSKLFNIPSQVRKGGRGERHAGDSDFVPKTHHILSAYTDTAVFRSVLTVHTKTLGHTDVCEERPQPSLVQVMWCHCLADVFARQRFLRN